MESAAPPHGIGKNAADKAQEENEGDNDDGGAYAKGEDAATLEAKEESGNDAGSGVEVDVEAATAREIPKLTKQTARRRCCQDK